MYVCIYIYICFSIAPQVNQYLPVILKLCAEFLPAAPVDYSPSEVRETISRSSVLQFVAECCIPKQCVAVCCSALQCVEVCDTISLRRPHNHDALQHTATHCNTLQRTATHRNATHRNAPQRTATHRSALQRTATHCNTLQHTTTAAIVWQGPGKRLLHTNSRIRARTIYLPTSFIFPQKSPVYLQKSPVYPQKSPVYPQKPAARAVFSPSEVCIAYMIRIDNIYISNYITYFILSSHMCDVHVYYSNVGS